SSRIFGGAHWCRFAFGRYPVPSCRWQPYPRFIRCSLIKPCIGFNDISLQLCDVLCFVTTCPCFANSDTTFDLQPHVEGRIQMMAKKSPNPTDKYVGSRVRMRRLMLGMSQEKLGEKLGLTFQQVQKYEKGTNRIGASRLQHIAQILKVPVSFFF